MAPVYIGLASTAADLPNLIKDGVPAIQTHFTSNNTTALYNDLNQRQLDALLVHSVLPAPAQPYWYNPVALDGLTLIVHPDNPIRDLSLGQIQALYSGRISNWQMLGGPDQAAILITRERDAGARAVFTQRVMAEQRVSINAIVQATNEGVIQAVAGQPGAIGYTMLGALPRATLTVEQAVRALSVGGVTPNPLTTADQSYPLTVPLYWVSLAEPQGAARAMLAWLQSDAGQRQLGVRYGRVR
jgi:phosphate transport system substrate-binding protein